MPFRGAGGGRRPALRQVIGRAGGRHDRQQHRHEDPRPDLRCPLCRHVSPLGIDKEPCRRPLAAPSPGADGTAVSWTATRAGEIREGRQLADHVAAEPAAPAGEGTLLHQDVGAAPPPRRAGHGGRHVAARHEIAIDRQTAPGERLLREPLAGPRLRFRVGRRQEDRRRLKGPADGGRRVQKDLAGSRVLIQHEDAGNRPPAARARSTRTSGGFGPVGTVAFPARPPAAPCQIRRVQRGEKTAAGRGRAPIKAILAPAEATEDATTTRRHAPAPPLSGSGSLSKTDMLRNIHPLLRLYSLTLFQGKARARPEIDRRSAISG